MDISLNDYVKGYYPLFFSSCPRPSHPLWDEGYHRGGDRDREAEGTRSKIHEHTISLRFLGIILRVQGLEVSEYNVYITSQFLTTFDQGGSKIH
jgi:hypothetical protein